jgi:hypothetical protein
MFGEERRRVAEISARLGADRESFARARQLLHERVGKRLASPAGLLLSFAAGAALMPIAAGVLRLAIGTRGLRSMALQSASLYRLIRGEWPRPPTRPVGSGPR